MKAFSWNQQQLFNRMVTYYPEWCGPIYGPEYHTAYSLMRKKICLLQSVRWGRNKHKIRLPDHLPDEYEKLLTDEFKEKRVLYLLTK